MFPNPFPFAFFLILMQFRTTLLPGLLAGALPLAGVAQVAAPAAPKTGYFMGLSAAVSGYQLPTGSYANVISPTPTMGAQLRPRWAVQASALYFQQNDSYDYTGLLFINGGLHQGVSVSTSRRHTVAVPVLARYTLTRRSVQRFRVDVLVGATVVRSTYCSSGTATDSLQNVVYSAATTSGPPKPVPTSLWAPACATAWASSSR